PDIGPSMRDHIRSQVAAPPSEPSIKHSQHADDQHLLQSLIGMSQTEDNALQQHSGNHAVCISDKLLLKIATEDDLLTDAGGDRYRNPKDDLKCALRQQIID